MSTYSRAKTTILTQSSPSLDPEAIKPSLTDRFKSQHFSPFVSLSNLKNSFKKEKTSISSSENSESNLPDNKIKRNSSDYDVTLKKSQKMSQKRKMTTMEVEPKFNKLEKVETSHTQQKNEITKLTPSQTTFVKPKVPPLLLRSENLENSKMSSGAKTDRPASSIGSHAASSLSFSSFTAHTRSSLIIQDTFASRESSPPTTTPWSNLLPVHARLSNFKFEEVKRLKIGGMTSRSRFESNVKGVKVPLIKYPEIAESDAFECGDETIFETDKRYNRCTFIVGFSCLKPARKKEVAINSFATDGDVVCFMA